MPKGTIYRFTRTNLSYRCCQIPCQTRFQMLRNILSHRCKATSAAICSASAAAKDVLQQCCESIAARDAGTDADINAAMYVVMHVQDMSMPVLCTQNH